MPHPEAAPLCPDTPLCDAETAPPLLSMLSEAARQQAMARFQIIQPFVERGAPLPEVARHHGVVPVRGTHGRGLQCNDQREEREPDEAATCRAHGMEVQY